MCRPGQFPPACEDVKVGDCPVAVAEPITMATVLVLSPAFPSVIIAAKEYLSFFFSF